MPKLLQINITANWGSHGRIAEDIGRLMMANGWESYIAYGRWANASQSNLIKIGSMADEYRHGVQSLLLNRHGLASRGATKQLIREIEKLHPDVIHLHNIHGYYLNYPLLFDYLSACGTPVVWTLHDCWPITGHCAYFTYARCDGWKTGCQRCRNNGNYPRSVWSCGSSANYARKKTAFTKLKNLTIVPVSDWLAEIVNTSFLSEYPVRMIHNGIDLDVFCPSVTIDSGGETGECIVLGVNSKWEERKGLSDFFELRRRLDGRFKIVLVGLSEKQLKILPDGIVGIARTNSINELADYYRRASVFVNPTYEDNFPTTNLEALACGTPVVTYRTGGSPEAVDEGRTGLVIPYGDIDTLAATIRQSSESGDFVCMRDACRQRAVLLYDKQERYKEYLNLYHAVLQP